jgi:hypothetical protein
VAAARPLLEPRLGSPTLMIVPVMDVRPMVGA